MLSITHISQVVTGHATRDPLGLPLSLLSHRDSGRWRCRSCTLQATGIKRGHYWLALGHWLASSPPTSIAHATGGRTVSLVFFLSHALSTATGYPEWCSAFSPNDIFAINCCRHGRSIIWAWHNQWWLPHWMRRFLKKNTLLSSAAPPSRNRFCRPCATLFDLTV